MERSPWSSMMRLLIWKKQATPCGQSYFRLSPSRRGIDDTACLLLPTLTKSMATPADMVQAQYSGADPRRPTYQEAKLMPTLLKRDQRCLSSAAPPPRQRGAPNLVQVSGGKLNADWCEWYMGFPEGWTDIDGDEFLPSATPVSRRKSPRSCKQSQI